MAFTRFQPSLFEFLEELADHNERPWFLTHKSRYESDVLGPALEFIRAFAPRLRVLGHPDTFDPGMQCVVPGRTNEHGYPSQAGSFLLTATFFNATYSGKPFLP